MKTNECGFITNSGIFGFWHFQPFRSMKYRLKDVRIFPAVLSLSLT